jgi:TRAP-type mannitol/chloroaromatic compound transport system permease large subunit
MLTIYQVPTKMSALLTSVSDAPILILLTINLMLLLLGMIMNMAALILICTPIFLPIATSIGVDPYQFGMILLMNLGLGLCTPPVGVVSVRRLCGLWRQARGCSQNQMAFLSGDLDCLDAGNIRTRHLADLS